MANKVVQKNDKKTDWKRGAIVIVALFWTFSAGWGFGSGRLHVGGLSATSQNKGLPANLDYSSVEQVYDELRANYDGKLDINKLTDGLKQGLVAASGDPYTEYMVSDEAKSFKSELSGSFEGVGALLGKNDAGNVIVVSPIDGFPAKKAGLMPKDVIVEIDGKDATKFTTDQAVEKIRGPKGTHVKLHIIRDEKQDLTFDIERAEIDIPSVETKILDGNVGYMKISQFGDDTSQLAQEAAAKFKDQNVSGVVLDLRGNPGGYLEAAVDVSSLWLPNNKTVLEEKRGGVTVQTYRSRGTATLSGIPTVVLIDGGSASASEITAGALHDNGVATLMGLKSFGKGSVQQPENLKNGALLKITIARWYTPNGKNIDKAGIKPDTEVKISADDIKADKDPQLDAATSKLKK